MRMDENKDLAERGFEVMKCKSGEHNTTIFLEPNVITRGTSVSSKSSNSSSPSFSHHKSANNHDMMNGSVLSIKLTEKESQLSFQMSPREIFGEPILASIFTNSDQATTKSFNWSAIGLKKIATPSPITPLPSSRNLCENDVYSNASGLYHKCTIHVRNWIFGDQEYLRLYLENKKLASPWLPLIMLSSFLRAFAQPLMINNMISGLLIFYGVARASPMGAIGSLVAFVPAFATSATLWCSRADESRKFWKWLIHGSAVAPATWLGHHLAKNACSAASVSSHSVWVLAFHNAPMIVLLSIICTLVQVSLLTHLSRLNFHPMHLSHFLCGGLAMALFAPHFGLFQQCYTLFEPDKNLPESDQLGLLIMWSTANDTKHVQATTTAASTQSTRLTLEQEETLVATTWDINEYLNFERPGTNFATEEYVFVNKTIKVMQQCFRGWCSIYECTEDSAITSGTFAILGAIIFSPWTFLDGCIGGFFAQIFALCLPGSCLSVLNDGIIAQNGILASVSINLFILYSPWSRVLAVFGAILSAFFSIALKNVLLSNSFDMCDKMDKVSSHHHPVSLALKAFSSLAFFIATVAILLSFSTTRGICQRVDVLELSHPAMHRRLFRVGHAVDDEANVFPDQ